MTAATSSANLSRRWLFGPVPDLLLGCGVGYALVFVFQLIDPARLQAWVPIGAAPLVILVSGTPHYGATLLRVYERADDRRAYAFFTVWATLLIAGLFLAGLESAWVGSLLLTVYLTWSPWHYSGQNYGVAMMFLRRRGVAVTPRVKSFFHASFFLSFALTFLALHGGGSAVGYAPFAEGGDTIRFLPLGLPATLTDVGLVVVGAAYLVSLAVAFGGFLRGGTARDLFPTAVLVATQALWFSVPVAVRHWQVWADAAPFANGAYAFLWVAAGHSIQYLWVTTYYAAGSAGAGVRGRYLLKCLLAGAAIWNVPLLLFGPVFLGWSGNEAGLTALVASAVNLHHFVLDGAIWKLRDGRVAQILIRGPKAGAAPAATPPVAPVAPARSWLRPLVWGAGAVCVAFVLARTYEREIGFRASLNRGDLVRARVATERLAAMGLDSPDVRLLLARAANRLQQPALAAQQIRHSLELRPTAQAWVDLGLVYENAGQYAEALHAYDEAVALAPEDAEALHRQGVALLALGRSDEARNALERAVALAPEQKLIAMNLDRARRAQHEPPAGDARRAASAAGDGTGATSAAAHD